MTGRRALFERLPLGESGPTPRMHSGIMAKRAPEETSEEREDILTLDLDDLATPSQTRGVAPDVAPAVIPSSIPSSILARSSTPTPNRAVKSPAGAPAVSKAEAPTLPPPRISSGSLAAIRAEVREPSPSVQRARRERPLVAAAEEVVADLRRDPRAER